MDRAEYTRIKFCGLRRLEDVIEAIDLGVDLLGFNFYPLSPRYIDPVACADLLAGLKKVMGEAESHCLLVGVFVNSPYEEIRHVMSVCGLDLAQLSGDETQNDIAHFDGRAYKAIRPRDGMTLNLPGTGFLSRKALPGLLVDAVGTGLYGGSGMKADWQLAEALARQVPILLAGGLTPENVTEAIHRVKPWGVDVASGIETSPGVKDHSKMVDFVQAVRDTVLEK